MTPEEIEAAHHLAWHEGLRGGWQPGAFEQSLVLCLSTADPYNQGKLLSIYPQYKAGLRILNDRAGEGRRLLEEAIEAGPTIK